MYKFLKIIYVIAIIQMTTSCFSRRSERTANMTPTPQAIKKDKLMTIHGDTRNDPYFWIRDMKWTTERGPKNTLETMLPEIRKHIEKENHYTDSFLKNLEKEKNEIFEEIKERIPADDQGVPYFKKGYWYYSKFEEAKEYPIYCRKKKNLEAVEEIILDVNELAGDAKVFKVAAIKVSPNSQLLAYAVDTSGNNLHEIFIKDLSSKKTLDFKLNKATSNFVWTPDSQKILVSEYDLKTLRNFKAAFIDIQSQAREEVFHEENEEFGVYVSGTRSEKFLSVGAYAKDSHEIYLIEAQKLHLLKAREEKHLYDVDHIGENFYILSNKEQENFDLYKLSEEDFKNNQKENWVKVVAGSKDLFINSYTLFENKIVLSTREKGQKDFLITDLSGMNVQKMPQKGSSYVVGTSSNSDPKLDYFRYSYESPVQPEQIIDFNLNTEEKTLQKEKTVGKKFEANDYETEALWVKSRDGVDIPVTLIKKKTTKKSSETPLLLYAYSSYGHNIDAYFSPSRISLLERGFIVAITNPRGSSFLGREWYLNGKFLKKKNTFYDFIDVGEYLVKNNITSRKKIFAMGGSAGGLLMGAVMNLAPELFHGIIAQVPFVDVVTTMLDADLPLTTGEYQEWGNPNEQEYYDYMKSYSPYDNVRKASYPKTYMTTGIHDTQVGYWEPLKWALKLRDSQLNLENPILCKIETETGHSGESGRFKAYQDVAEIYALLSEWAKD